MARWDDVDDGCWLPAFLFALDHPAGGERGLDRYGRPTRVDHRADWVRPLEQNYDRRERPYSFSEFFLFRDGRVRPAGHGDFHAKVAPGIEGAYSDRLQGWNYEAYKAAVEAIKGMAPINSWSREKAVRFLTVYFGKTTDCAAMAEGCNSSNGYPYLIFWYRHEEAPAAPPEVPAPKSSPSTANKE